MLYEIFGMQKINLMKHLFLIILFSFSIFTYSQFDKKVEKETIVLNKTQEFLLNKCFDKLVHLEKFIVYGNLSTKEMCSINGCFLYLYYDDQVKTQMQKRLVQIAKRFHKEGYFIQLISGPNSVEYCNKQNVKHSPKDKIVYIPIKHKTFRDFTETKNLFNNLMQTLWDY